MQAPYVYEDKYLSDPGKVSAVNIESPDYEEQPLLRHATFTEVTVSKGDILYIPVYWWHQVHSQNRTIGLTMWFDPWNLTSVLGSGKHQPTDYLVRTLKSWQLSQGGSKMSAADWESTPNRAMVDACRANEGICRQNMVSHNFCNDEKGRDQDLEALLEDLGTVRDAGEEEEGEAQKLVAQIHASYSRPQVNRAMNQFTHCDKAPAEGASVAAEEGRMVALVGNLLYFENESFLQRAREAHERGDIAAFLEGFSAPEKHRIINAAFLELDKEPGDATSVVYDVMGSIGL